MMDYASTSTKQSPMYGDGGDGDAAALTTLPVAQVIAVLPDREREEAPLLITTITASSVDSTKLIEVTAPGTLPAGYEFAVTLPDRRVVKVIVPHGGIAGGQAFMAQPYPLNHVVTAAEQFPARPFLTVGSWRDGLCDCCSLGCCHPSLCMTWWFRPLALGQVMTRMNLTAWGAKPAQAKSIQPRMSPFMIMALVLIGYIILSFVFGMILNPYAEDESEEPEGEQQQYPNEPSWVKVVRCLQYLVELGVLVYILIHVAITRRHVRRMFQIKERCCLGCEDCCCAFFCGCCTVAQMLRQTSDYDHEMAMCCSETGLAVI